MWTTFSSFNTLIILLNFLFLVSCHLETGMHDWVKLWTHFCNVFNSVYLRMHLFSQDEKKLQTVYVGHRFFFVFFSLQARGQTADTRWIEQYTGTWTICRSRINSQTGAVTGLCSTARLLIWALCWNNFIFQNHSSKQKNNIALRGAWIVHWITTELLESCLFSKYSRYPWV